ncbi:MAG: DUF364 domain-containing protein [Synergistaceae bacterium]|nr:DUF364 domain-containing protein [Synergistaceae bacterium]
MIADCLIKNASEASRSRKIKDIRVGLGYICTMLESGECGLAYSFRNELGHCCSVLAQAGDLIGKKCEELIPWLKEKDLLRAAVGLSVVNAVLNDRSHENEAGNVIKAIKMNKDETFGMVGDFKPILPFVRKQTDNIYVFERIPQEKNGLYPDKDIPRYLTECDVVVVTGTSIINNTIDDVLRFCSKAREVFIVGPSTPLSPESFIEHNVTCLAGTVVTAPDKMLRIISQGGGTMQMKPASKHVLVKVGR